MVKPRVSFILAVRNNSFPSCGCVCLFLDFSLYRDCFRSFLVAVRRSKTLTFDVTSLFQSDVHMLGTKSGLGGTDVRCKAQNLDHYSAQT